jgi:hypothetical protein
MRYSPKVRAALMAAGWFPHRSVATRFWVEELESDGFTMTPASIVLLGEFGGLMIHPVKTSEDAYIADRIEFDPVLAASGDFYRVNYWQKQIGKILSPIAETGSGMLLIDEDGGIYSCGDRILYFDGNTLEDAF